MRYSCLLDVVEIDYAEKGLSDHEQLLLTQYNRRHGFPTRTEWSNTIVLCLLGSQLVPLMEVAKSMTDNPGVQQFIRKVETSRHVEPRLIAYNSGPHTG